MAGYDDTNDAERLCVDPAMRYVAGGRAIERSSASTSAMGRFKTEILTQPKNLEFLMNLPGVWVYRVHQRKLLKQIVLDMDSSVSSTHVDQEGSAYNCKTTRWGGKKIAAISMSFDIMGIQVCMSVSVKCIWEIPDL